MTHKKALFGLCILLVSMAIFTVSGFAQDEGAGSETPLRGQVRECMEARRALRQAGIQISQDNLPEGCAFRGEGFIERLSEGGRERGQQFAACIEAIQELRNAGQRVTREEALELEECASVNARVDAAANLDRQSMTTEGGWFGQLGEQLSRQRGARALQREARTLQREEQTLQRGERMLQFGEELAQRSAECRDAIRELRDVGQQVTRENLPEECSGLRRRNEVDNPDSGNGD